MKRIFATILVILVAATSVLAAAKDRGLLFEYVGQVTNSGPNSTQYGNLSAIAGAPSGAYFTFYTMASNSAVSVNGPMRIIDRTGTTTIYLNSALGDFANPDSFRSGIPVQVSNLQQQVIVNTSNGAFSVVNTNIVTSATDAGEMFGDEGDSFRTYLNGQLNSAGAPPPSGWFGGYAVSVK